MRDKVSESALARALTYVAKTGSKRGLQIQTRIAMTEDLLAYLDRPKFIKNILFMYQLTEHGLEIARKSAMWKGVEMMEKEGFVVDSKGCRPRCINMRKWVDDESSKFGGYNVHAYIFADGSVHAPEDNKRFTTRKVAQFKDDK
ncbi:hypothetical protein EVB91_205 [Rhizobium phage RHph_I1_18]|nr:hypothetical protein EVB91_205 [Rhizobium phage RHph_I1_18]